MMKKIAIVLLRFYKLAISPYIPSRCIYTPTCSEYAVEAVQQYGVLRGCWLAFRRLCRCHPFAKGGYDPLP